MDQKMWDELKGAKNTHLVSDTVSAVFVLLAISEPCCCGGLELWLSLPAANGFCAEDSGLTCGELRLLNCEDEGDMTGGLFTCSFSFMTGVEGWVDGLAAGCKFVDFPFSETELVWLAGAVRVCEGRLVRDLASDLACSVATSTTWRSVLELTWLATAIETPFWEERWSFPARPPLESGGSVSINSRLSSNMSITPACWELCPTLVWKGIPSFGTRSHGSGAMCP